MSKNPHDDTGWSKEWPAERGFYWTRDTPDDTNILLVEVNRNRLTICGDDRHRNVNEAFVDSEFLGPISPSDFEQLVRLRDWKESAMKLLSRYDSIAETFGGKLGSLKVDNLERGVERLRKAASNALKYLEDTGESCRTSDLVTALREALPHTGEKS